VSSFPFGNVFKDRNLNESHPLMLIDHSHDIQSHDVADGARLSSDAALHLIDTTRYLNWALTSDNLRRPMHKQAEETADASIHKLHDLNMHFQKLNLEVFLQYNEDCVHVLQIDIILEHVSG
jgi:hypothetical protein